MALRSEWYAYLASMGFEDIEKNVRLVDHKSQEDLFYRRDFQTRETFEARQSYYQWARSMLEWGNFKSITDKMVWEFHADGLTSREIAPRIGLNQSSIVRRLHRIEEGLKFMVSSCYSALSVSTL